MVLNNFHTNSITSLQICMYAAMLLNAASFAALEPETGDVSYLRNRPS